MAISCLMLEALESFLRGWKKSVRQSGKLFVEFLDREADFAAFRGRSSETAIAHVGTTPTMGLLGFDHIIFNTKARFEKQEVRASICGTRTTSCPWSRAAANATCRTCGLCV